MRGVYEIVFEVGEYFAGRPEVGDAPPSSTAYRCGSASPSRRRTTTFRCLPHRGPTVHTGAVEMDSLTGDRPDLATSSEGGGRMEFFSPDNWQEALEIKAAYPGPGPSPAGPT